MRKFLFFLLLTFIAGITFNHVSAAPVIVAGAKLIPSKADPDPAKVQAAMTEFKSLSHREKKMMLKEVKATIRDYKKEKKEGQEPSTNTLLMVIIAILLPPLAVYLHEGEINNKFWIDLLLTLIFWLPGVIYALVVILDKD
jgi:uncharacterized membrane protein YqaE (UPF0057 family)